MRIKDFRKASHRAFHVVLDPDGGWNVKKRGALRASRHFDTKKDAESWARAASLRQHSDLVIHKRDGTIQRKDFHGRNPEPQRDQP